MLSKGQNSRTRSNDDPVILYKQPVCRLGYPRLLCYLYIFLLVNVPVNCKCTDLAGAAVTADKHPSFLEIFQIFSNRNF